MPSLRSLAPYARPAVVPPVPYIALGDSLTQGAQSLGVAAISQRCSYPRLIAEFLGAEPFGQPLLKGDLDTLEDGWVGNPPNLELVLRLAEKRLPDDVLAALCAQRSITFGEQVGSAWAALREAVRDYIQAVETRHPDEFLVEQPGVHRPFQNLGVLSYTIPDVGGTAYHQGDQPAPVWSLGHLGHLVQRAAGQIASTWSEELRAHQNPLAALLGEAGALLGDLAGLAGGQVGARLEAEKLAYVLGREGQTALELAREQQPHIVTLFIGNTEGPIAAALAGRMTDDQGHPIWADPEIIRSGLKALLDEILAFESRPYVFLATLPSPTATPSLVRDRLGHWKPLLPPTPDYLSDADLQGLESVASQYNQVIRELAHSHRGPYKRVCLVDVHALHERMLRGTRRDAEAARRAVAHGLRIGGIDQGQARALLEAARAGRPDILNKLGYGGPGRLLHTSAGGDFSNAARTRQRKYIQQVAGLVHAPAAREDQGPNVDDFRVELASGDVYRLTGEYLASDADHKGQVVQGGLVGLDGIHLTNTGYAYVARHFLQEMRKAHARLGDVLEWVSPDGTRSRLPGADQGDAALDQMVLRVAREDSLLNQVPCLLPAVIDLLDALGEILGSVRAPAPVAQRA
jgi:hypothetical protein